MSAAARVLDTRNGTGGFSSPMPASSWRTIKVAGIDGIPTTGVGAVSVVVTAVNTGVNAQVMGRPDASTPSTLVLIYGPQNNTTASASLAVADDGTIQLMAESTINLVVDVQGYYTTTENGVADGGFVSVPGNRLADTRTGEGITLGDLAKGATVTTQVTGKAGVPAGASAVVANFIMINNDGTPGSFIPYATGTDIPDAGLNYNSVTGTPTSASAQVALSADGKMSLKNAANGAAIDVVIDIQGYFTKTAPGGAYTPGTGRIIDTRTAPNTAVAADGELAIQIGAARRGVPTVEGGLSAVAVTLTSVHDANTQGRAVAWADGQTEPDPFTSINYAPAMVRSNTIIVPVGANGKIRLHNISSSSTHFVVDLQGWYNALPAGPETTNLTGSRTSATTVSFGISDQAGIKVDVATGNLMLSTSAMNLPGVTSSAQIGATYNSRSTLAADSNTPDANRWQYSLAGAGHLTSNTTGVAYVAADGSTWQFTPTGATGAFTSPAGLQQTLQRTATEYVMSGWASSAKMYFTLAGQPSKIVDRNSNTTTFTRPQFLLTKITATAGPTDARAAEVAYTDGTTTFTQNGGASSRSAVYVKDASGNIVSFTNTNGERTTFGYTNGDLTTITAPGGGVTTVNYDSSDRVTRVNQQNTTTGSPGTATTRFSYTSTTETLVADPNTDASVAVASVPFTRYTIDPTTSLVKKTVDPEGRVRSAEYNAANNAVKSTASGVSSNKSTSTGTFGANNNQSLTQVEAGSGSTSKATYGSTSATAYLPATSTDSSNETTTYGFDGLGNQTSTTTGSGAQSSTAKLEYNTDGSVKTATAPGNAGNPTKYAYNTNKQLSTITAPTGTSLGVKTFTYDAYGRQATQTDGDGGTTTYTYDNADRLLSTSFSDSTATVTNTYDKNGNLIREISGPGTVTKTYDQQNRLVSTANTASGGTIRFGYDKASNETSITTSTGTTTHTYDNSNLLVKSLLPNGTGTLAQVYELDDQGRRINTWLGASEEHTKWAAKSSTSYDSAGRVSTIKAWTGTGDASNTRVFDTSYCYQAGTTAPTCTAAKTTDRDTIQWARDNITGQVTTYTYATGRLTKAAQTGGATNSTWTYTYDANGNRTAETTTGANAGGISLTFNAASQITSSGYAYDGAGNLTKSPTATYTYNGAQQMTSSTRDGVTTTYTYAGTDQNQLLSEKTATGTSYTYVYGGVDGAGVPEIVAQNTSGAGTSSVLTDPITGQALNLTTTDGVTGLYLVDAIGNQVGLLTETRTTAFRVAYSPYGAQAVTAGAASDAWEQNPYGFKNGNRTDNGVLVKFGMRWYLAITGTWTQRDTLDAPLDPENANRYGYAGGDPINNIDSTGQITCATASALLGVGAGLAAVGFAVAAPFTGGTSLIPAFSLYVAVTTGGLSATFGAATLAGRC